MSSMKTQDEINALIEALPLSQPLTADTAERVVFLDCYSNLLTIEGSEQARALSETDRKTLLAAVEKVAFIFDSRLAGKLEFLPVFPEAGAPSVAAKPAAKKPASKNPTAKKPAAKKPAAKKSAAKKSAAKRPGAAKKAPAKTAKASAGKKGAVKPATSKAKKPTVTKKPTAAPRRRK